VLRPALRHVIGYPATAVLALGLGAACNDSPDSEPRALVTAPPQVSVRPQLAPVQLPPTAAPSTPESKPRATARPSATTRPRPTSSPKPAATAKPKPASSCDPNYSGCVPIASDVDCAGGSGNGPKYVQGPVRVIGRDIYDLDGSDNDGVGCE